jgi:hypothetical protein
MEIDEVIELLQAVKKSGNHLQYGLGNTTALISNVSPAVGMSFTGLKFGCRAIQTYKSYCKAGGYNPIFYLNAGATTLSMTSVALQATSYLFRTSCPPAALICYSGSVACSGAADTLDNYANTRSLFSLFF